MKEMKFSKHIYHNTNLYIHLYTRTSYIRTYSHTYTYGCACVYVSVQLNYCQAILIKLIHAINKRI